MLTDRVAHYNDKSARNGYGNGYGNGYVFCNELKNTPKLLRNTEILLLSENKETGQ